MYASSRCCLPEQHSVRHVLDDGLVGGAVLEADGVAHLLAQQAPELLSHALRHRHGRHPARLGAADLACDNEMCQLTAISLLSLASDFPALAAPNAPLDGATSRPCSSQLLHF